MRRDVTPNFECKQREGLHLHRSGPSTTSAAPRPSFEGYVAGTMGAAYESIGLVPVQVAGKPFRAQLLHRQHCMHLRWDGEWPEPVLREATADELRTRRQCGTCIAVDKRERRLR
jgi:hypothetical protein